MWHALLQTLVDELARQAEQSKEPKVKQQLGHLLTRLRRLSLAATWLLSRQVLTDHLHPYVAERLRPK